MSDSDDVETLVVPAAVLATDPECALPLHADTEQTTIATAINRVLTIAASR